MRTVQTLGDCTPIDGQENQPIAAHPSSGHEVGGRRRSRSRTSSHPTSSARHPHGRRPARPAADECDSEQPDERLPSVSRDIFVQDMPEDISSVDEIPDDWQPRSLPFGHAEVVEAVRELAPEVEATDPEWLHVRLPGVDVEVNVTDESPLESFALHVRASDPEAADAFVSRLLGRLGARAFDPESESGIFQA